MKKFMATVTMLSIFGFLLAVGVSAQPATGPGTTREPSVTYPATPGLTSPGLMHEAYASKLIGATVKNTQGENLGKIDDLVIDPKDARIKSAVLSIGGVLGMGAKTVAVPWDKVTMGSERDTVVVAMAKDDLERAPVWQKSER